MTKTYYGKVKSKVEQETLITIFNISVFPSAQTFDRQSVTIIKNLKSLTYHVYSTWFLTIIANEKAPTENHEPLILN